MAKAQASPAKEGGELPFYGEGGGGSWVGGYFKGKFTGENHKLGVMVVSHWLSCRGS